MLVSFNPNVSNNNSNLRNQNIKFGDLLSASKTKDDLMFAIANKDIAKRIKKAEAIQQIEEAMKKEDKIGQKILQLFKEQISAWKGEYKS